MNNLPLDIQENIYKRLPPKDRVKLKLVLPKTSARIYKPKIERKLAVVNNYINKNKVHIKDKTKLIPLNIMSFIKDNQNDNFIKKLGNFLMFTVESKISGTQTLCACVDQGLPTSEIEECPC